MIDQYPSANGVLTSLIWRKTMSGGETSLSGYDNASQALSYTPGQEQVYLNGILLVRGDDYTATNGTSITGLSALSASDFVQVNCYNNFSVATTPATSITGTIANNQLANSSITINGSAVSLGGSVTLAGDIESVTAGTGLSGGGSSGAVTVSLDTTSQYVVPSQSGNSGKYLTTNGTATSWGTVTAVDTLNIVRLTSGTSWSVPSGIKSATIYAIGGGGGGGGHNTNGNCGGGGGAGGLASGTFDLSSVAGSTISYSIGSGGIAGVGSTTTNGGNGGNTTFGTVGQAWYLSATGGAGGATNGGASLSSGGCGAGAAGTSGGTSSAGGGGGGIGGHGRAATSVPADTVGSAGTQGGAGGNGGSTGSRRGAGGVGINIHGYFVGGGGNGGNQNGYGYFVDNSTWGAGATGNTGNGTAGTANTGAGGSAGGGPSGSTYNGGAGGSGVIIIAYNS